MTSSTTPPSWKSNSFNRDATGEGRLGGVDHRLAGLAEFLGLVREQPVVALLVPRQPVAAAARLAVAVAPLGDVVDAEAVLRGRLSVLFFAILTAEWILRKRAGLP